MIKVQASCPVKNPRSTFIEGLPPGLPRRQCGYLNVVPTPTQCMEISHRESTLSLVVADKVMVS